MSGLVSALCPFPDCVIFPIWAELCGSFQAAVDTALEGTEAHRGLDFSVDTSLDALRDTEFLTQLLRDLKVRGN